MRYYVCQNIDDKVNHLWGYDHGGPNKGIAFASAFLRMEVWVVS
jgi:hypothetical protein